MGHVDLKSWVTSGTKIRPGISSNLRIFESIWLSISSQFYFQYRVNLSFNIESIWLSISSQFVFQYRVNWTLNIESIWLSISSQFDSQYRVNLTLNIESIWLSISSQFDSNILQLLGIPGRILVPPVTQLFRSKWFHFFFQWACIHLHYMRFLAVGVKWLTFYIWKYYASVIIITSFSQD